MTLGLTLFGRRFELRTKALPTLRPLSGQGGWWSVVREPFGGAWQRNVAVDRDTVLAYFAVFSCITLIAADIAKLKLRLVLQDANGIWTEAQSPAFSPVLRKPNRYQTMPKFVEQWIVSKLIHGNTYVLKQYDNRGGQEQGVVSAMYILDPTRVTPLVAADGSVYYELKRDDLAAVTQERLIVPASEIIHDTMVALFHPLMGVTPLYASGVAASQGIAIQTNSTTVFANGSMPGGVLTAPGPVTDDAVARLKSTWDGNHYNAGTIAILTEGLKFEKTGYNAVDLQLIEQLKWTAENVCSCYHVPAYMVGVGPPPPYANVEPSVQAYYSQCLQSLITAFETALDEGLGIATKVNGQQYGTEFDVDDLIWMDTATRTKAAGDSIGAGALSPNEARKKYFGLGPVTGGESPMVQQQYYSLAALAQRDADDPFAKPAAPVAPAVVEDDDEDIEDDDAVDDAQAASVGPLFRNALIEAGLIHA